MVVVLCCVGNTTLIYLMWGGILDFTGMEIIFFLLDFFFKMTVHFQNLPVLSVTFYLIPITLSLLICNGWAR